MSSEVNLEYCYEYSRKRAFFWLVFPAGIYTKTRFQLFSKLTIKTPKRSHWRRSGVFIVNFDHILLFVLFFPLLTLSR